MFSDFDSLTFDEAATASTMDTAVADSLRVKMLQREHLWKRFSSTLADAAQFDNMTELQLKVKADIVDRQYDTFEKIQFALEELDESQFDGTHRIDFETAYIAVKSAIASRLKSLNMEQLNSSSPKSSLSSSSPTQSEMKQLPKLQLSKFDGRHTEWSRYHSLFVALVHNNDDFSDNEKFEYLRSSLGESAVRLIETLEVTPENYAKAIDMLVAHYENKRLIFQTHLSAIFAVQKINQPTVSALRKLVDSVNGNFRAMQSLATTDQIVDGFLLHLITSKLDDNTQQLWEQEVATRWEQNANATLQLPAWQDLTEFLDSRSNRKAPAKPSPLKPISNNGVTTMNLFEKCLLCDGHPYHNAFNCNKFNKMNAFERHDLAKRLKLCLNCLRPNHSSNSCPSQRRCQQCRVSHHTLLHRTYDNNSVANIKPSKSEQIIDKLKALHQSNQLQY